jgi:hypothetical protein
MGRALEENRSRRHPFEVMRNYKLFGKETRKVKSDVTVQIRYAPPDGEEYTVHQANGAALGEMIVRKILENEKELLTRQGATDLSPANYRFRLLGEDEVDGRACYRLELYPLRRDGNLLKGVVWIDASTYLIDRVEGEPAKPPSWWVHDIHLTLDFGVVEGLWLQTGLVSTAEVRLLGRHTIVSHDLEYHMGGIEAAAGFAHHVAAR